MDDQSDDIRRPQVSRIEIFAGSGRQRWDDAVKARIVAESLAPGAIVTHVARRHGCRPQQVHDWRRLARADESQRLDITPAKFQVIVTRRPKLACRACIGTVLQHPAPERLLKGGLPTERLVAHVIDAKYHWHLPLYRQAQMFATHGLAIDRSTLAFWIGYAAQELRPLYRLLRARPLQSSKLCVDGTTAPVLDPGKGKTKIGYFWAISRDDRPWNGPEPPGVAYAYAPGRGAVHGLKLLDGFAGVVHCDGYVAYKAMVKTRAGGQSRGRCAAGVLLGPSQAAICQDRAYGGAGASAGRA